MQGTLGVVDVEASVAVKEFFMSGCNGRNGTSVTYSGSDGLHDEYMRKFRHEAEHLSHFRHDNIVRVLEMFEENGTWYYAMEYIDGGSLNDYILRRGRLPADEALSLARQVAVALAYLHGQKALHLDLKPSNIMLRDNGQPVLIDFGLTKQYASDGRAETSTSIGLGTQGYAPMEQNNYHKGKKFAPTIDIYALGATLYKMLTGSTPPAATDIFNEGFPESDLKAAGVDDKTIALVRKAMEPRSNDRYQTADEMAAAIELLTPAGSTASNKSHVETGDEKTILDTEAATNTIAGHEFVDLGLSVKWAMCNVGADSPEDYGDYYVWGETATKLSYDIDNCETWEQSIGDIKGTSRDVAHVKWGGSWRMPTKAEFDELLDSDNCTWEWTALNGKKGYKVTSRKNGNSIFLPAAYWRLGTLLNNIDTWGYYWSSTPYESNTQYAYDLNFDSSCRNTDWSYRGCGFTVRPVAEF